MLTQSGPCKRCKDSKVKCSLTPLRSDGTPDRIRFDTHTAKMLRHWVKATNDALKLMGLPTNQETPSGDQPSGLPSSTLGQLGQLSLQGDPSPTDVHPPVPNIAGKLPPASHNSLAAGPTLPTSSRLTVPRDTAGAPPHASRSPHIPHRDLVTPSQPSAPHDMASAPRNTAVSRSSAHSTFCVEITRRGAPKASSSHRHSRRARQISSTSPESAHAHAEPSQAGDEGTDSARIASLEQKVVSLEQMIVSLQQRLETYEAWKAEVEEWRAEVNAWRAEFE